MSQPALVQLGEGIVYRNPTPHLRSRQAFHPSLLQLDDGELICTFDIGEAIESLDYRTFLARSHDNGETWTFQGKLIEPPPGRTASLSVRTSRAQDGSLVGFGGVYYRDNPDAGLTNRDTLGYVPMDLIQTRSFDRGHTWSAPSVIKAPLVGPSFETCHAIVELPSGRWLGPTATWRGWNGEAPSGEKTIVLISDDQGETWPDYGLIFDGTEQGVIHWEISVAPLGAADGGDECLLAICWLYDPKSGKHLPNPYAVSVDGGNTFSGPYETGLHGMTCKAIRLRDRTPDGPAIILSAYRRVDRPGLWANLSTLVRNDSHEKESPAWRWTNVAELPLWGADLSSSGMTGAGRSADELSAIKFGFPSLLQLPDGNVLLVHWCEKECTTQIRWVRLGIVEE